MFRKLLLTSLIAGSILSPAQSKESHSIKAGHPSIAKASQSTANQLVLSVGAFDPLDEKLTFSHTQFTNTESKIYSIVQFFQGKADSQWFQKNGITVVSYLPNNAFVIVNKNSNQAVLEKNNDIRWQGPYLSSYKISPNLWETNRRQQQNHEIMVSVFNNFPKKNLSQLFLKFLPKAMVKEILYGDANEAIISIDNQYIDEYLKKLSLIEQVQYVEKIIPLEFSNTEAVSAVQGNLPQQNPPSNDDYSPTNTPIWDKNLIGTGQIIGVSDSGLDSNEDWFIHYDNGTKITSEITEAETTNPPAIGTLYPDRKVIGYFVQPGAMAYDESDHGTHVTASTSADRLMAIGDGPEGSISSPNSPGYDNDDGMAPNAQILFQDIGANDEDGNPVLIGFNPTAMWDQAYTAGVRIHSNSYGSPTEGEYTSFDRIADRTLRKYEDLFILFAAGNNGAAINSVGSPAVSKNVLSVGALFHGNSRFVASYSNRGPTDDGRVKPDIVATGTSIESAKNDGVNDKTTLPPRRFSISGTSMSTPITAGSSALLRQYYTDGFYPTGEASVADQRIPTGALMKATLINGAGVDGGHFDKNVGWGRVNLAGSLPFSDGTKRLRAWEIANDYGLKTGQNSQFEIGVKAGEELNVTLAWYDLPGPLGSTKTLINDLDLSVEFNGQTYKGNVFSSTATSGLGGEYDRLNTVEQIRIPFPSDGIYTIKVSGANIPGDGSDNSFKQGFGLVATGLFDNIDSSPAPLTAVNNLSATMQGQNGIEISWDGGNNADYFEVYKMQGNCQTADFKQLRYVGNSETQSYIDFSTLNGTEYAYKIRAAQHQELGELSDSCIDITSLQACDALPNFIQSSITVVNNVGDLCHTQLNWLAATSNCPSSPVIQYNVYRSEDPEFTPSQENLLTTTSSTNFDDIRAPDVTAYYVVRAEDNNMFGNGPNGGSETTGTQRLKSLAVGTGFQSIPIFEDVDNIAIMNLSDPWQVVSNQAADGLLSYKTDEANHLYPAETCSSIVTDQISLTSGDIAPEISYQASYNLENNWDGVVVEISTDDGQSWVDFPPNGGYPGDFSETVPDNNGVLINACRYPATQGAFSGNRDSFQTYTHDLSPFDGEDVLIRWRLSTDAAAEEDGFYIDSINYPRVQFPNACTVNTGADKPQPGLYFDRGHNGHGFAIEPINNSDLYFTVFYTYKDDGTPEWYTSVSTLENNVLNVNMDNNTLQRFIYDSTINPTGAGNPNTIDTSTGTNVLQIDFNNATASASDACNDGTANRGDTLSLATWQLGEQAGEWCIEPLIAQSAIPSPDFGGTWWAGSDDEGWGLSFSFSGGSIVVTLYYFDENGTPRWAQGIQSGFNIGEEITVNVSEFAGYARDETPTTLTSTIAGTITMTLNNNSGNDNDGVLSMDVNYQGTEGGSWTRSNSLVKIFTQAH